MELQVVFKVSDGPQGTGTLGSCGLILTAGWPCALTRRKSGYTHTHLSLEGAKPTRFPNVTTGQRTSLCLWGRWKVILAPAVEGSGGAAVPEPRSRASLGFSGS